MSRGKKKKSAHRLEETDGWTSDKSSRRACPNFRAGLSTAASAYVCDGCGLHRLKHSDPTRARDFFDYSAAATATAASNQSKSHTDHKHADHTTAGAAVAVASRDQKQSLEKAYRLGGTNKMRWDGTGRDGMLCRLF